MFKIISTIILTTVVILFSLQNSDHVPVYFFLGKAINIRLIFVITISGLTGYFIRLFIGIAREEHLKRQIHVLMKQLHQVKKKMNQIDVDEEL